ncbi:general secretion pathway protein [Brevundimonas diminuta]|uniref:type II secretion system protein N n=1 Tax=Brevundimonas diminuta TaxID=293 RepID=UPI002098466A|nr:type II secretion system protein N [Brevundimonas diminuta]MCO8017351.1 general secretion pathway protein [Brevundimonas diminuta]MCO8020871.1 general secretion pathway protein [Brevundimonas diminuta]
MSSLLSGLRKLSGVSWGRGGLSFRRLPLRRVVEAALILLLLVQAGRLVWLFAAPAPQAVQARPLPEVDLSILSRFDAFRNGGGGAEAAPSDGGGLTLFGVRADGAGGGSAIIGLSDGRQVSVGAGEELEAGLTLTSVAPDHVMLSRGTAPFRLDFPDMASGVAPATTPQLAVTAAEPASAEGVVVDPQRLIAQAGLRPRIQGLGVNGLTVSASGDGSELRNAGLRSGDVIVSVNAVALNSPQALAALRGQLADAPSAQIQFERDGQVRSTTVRTRP